MSSLSPWCLSGVAVKTRIDDLYCHFAQPLQTSPDLLLRFRSHKIKLLADEELNCVLGIEGQLAIIDDSFVNQSIGEQTLEEFQSAVTQVG